MLELLEVDTGANERPGEATIWLLFKSLVMPNNEKKAFQMLVYRGVLHHSS